MSAAAVEKIDFNPNKMAEQYHLLMTLLGQKESSLDLIGAIKGLFDPLFLNM